MWHPRTNHCRRIAGILLRHHRQEGACTLTSAQEFDCVETLTRNFIPLHIPKNLGEMWMEHGQALLSREETERPEDVELRKVISKGQGNGKR